MGNKNSQPGNGEQTRNDFEGEEQTVIDSLQDELGRLEEM